jgi:hypothetical protein
MAMAGAVFYWVRNYVGVAVLVKPFDFLDVMRRKLGEYFAVRGIDLGHGGFAVFAKADVRFIPPSAAVAPGKVDNADANAGKWRGSQVIAIPVAITNTPLPCYLVQARTKRVSRRVFANKGISSGHSGVNVKQYTWVAAAIKMEQQ